MVSMLVLPPKQLEEQETVGMGSAAEGSRRASRSRAHAEEASRDFCISGVVVKVADDVEVKGIQIMMGPTGSLV